MTFSDSNPKEQALLLNSQDGKGPNSQCVCGLEDQLVEFQVFI